VENNLKKNGHKMAEKLSDAGIKSTVIPDTAIYAVMQRVHKAFLSKQQILILISLQALIRS
jgi:translation initiation factor eIF-2B subunit beta